MIELLQNHRLVFTFPEVHPDARLSVEFQRTLRIPDDGTRYPLPPGLGAFPLRHVDDFARTAPPRWLEHGGVMMPMYQSEALWIRFDSQLVQRRGTGYPFAIKVAAGKIDAVTGRPYRDALSHAPQDYLVAPRQPWLDGYCVERGTIRQFVAMPLGSGYSAEEQITQLAEHGGLQILVRPMSAAAFERRFPQRAETTHTMKTRERTPLMYSAAPDMALAPGGRMHQEVYEDPFDPGDWEPNARSRCFVHIANSLVWRAITGELPPTPPPTAREYTEHGLPWFEYYADAGAQAVQGGKALADLKSVIELANQKADSPLPENESATPQHVIALRSGLAKDQVREGAF